MRCGDSNKADSTISSDTDMSVCGLRERERDLQDMIWSAPLLCMFFGRNVYPSQQIDCHSFSVCWDVISITSDELYNEIHM